MFKPEANNKEVETIIGPTVKVDGNFVGQGNVVVEGIVKGSLKTKKNLKVGTGAQIMANVVASNALVAGEIKGNIKINESLDVKSTAKILGDIETKSLSVEKGAIINGKCSMLAEEPVSKPVKENKDK